MPRFYETTLSITNLHNLSISTHVNCSRINTNANPLFVTTPCTDLLLGLQLKPKNICNRFIDILFLPRLRQMGNLVIASYSAILG